MLVDYRDFWWNLKGPHMERGGGRVKGRERQQRKTLSAIVGIADGDTQSPGE